MEYKAYRLEFQGPIHFGRQNLEEGEYTCSADTLFSALCQEALKKGENVLQSLYQYAKEGKMLISDAFPCIGNTFFLPKPMKRIAIGNNRINSLIKKADKKLKYIPMERLTDYLTGRYDVTKAVDVGRELGYFQMKVSASVRGEEETKPYRIGAYYFNKNNGLYVIMGYGEQKVREIAEELWRGLAFSGLGGKRSAGMGRFFLCPCELPVDFDRRLKEDGREYMSLSVSLPREEELAETLADAWYQLCRRSGFVVSDSYSGEQMRKKDLYVLTAGSCFHTRYEGDVYDVSGEKGGHPVYRYARPMLLGVDI